ncbi:MAG: FkbM family methyltransferase [Bacteroidetes bacterium]|nr:FkbM family methyltransferase [Bacteroidota bacterium]
MKSLYQLIKNSNLYFRIICILKPYIKREREINLKFYGQFIKPGQLCFDIGANIGAKTNIFNLSGATVVAVEPDPSAFSALKEKYNNKNTIHLLNIGLGSSSTEKTLHNFSNHALSTFDDIDAKNTLCDPRFTGFAFEKTTLVKLQTIDMLIQKFGIPDYCKISTVGYELEIIKGLSHPIPALSITCNLPHHVNKTIECIDLMERLATYRYNYFLSNLANGFAVEKWLNSIQIKEIITQLPQKTQSRYIEVFAVKL